MGERIPDDVMEAALKSIDDSPVNFSGIMLGSVVNVAVSAILAERERCAKIVEAEFQNNRPDYRCIAQSIRGES